MAAIIEIRGLSKQYGRLTALRGLDLQVEQGTVFGFVGPNGAGKTTTMRILATLLRPTAGEAWIAGHSVLRERRDVRQAIGYMPDFFGVYGDMKVWEYLDFFAACYEVPAEVRQRLAGDLLELVDLTHRREDYVDALSRGMKQRLCLARALAHDPQVLILDEPASGLDPRARVEIRELLRELQGMGKTIFVSSHILSEIEEVCTHIGIIEAGSLVATGTLKEMRKRIEVQRVVRVGLTTGIAEAQAWLSNQPDVVAVDRVEDNGPGDLQVVFSGDDEALVRLLNGLVSAGFAVLSFREETGDLEDVFMRLTKGVVSEGGQGEEGGGRKADKRTRGGGRRGGQGAGIVDQGRDMTAKKIALITGITGQDGSYLAEFLLEKGYEVIGLVRRSTHYHYENIDHLAGQVTLEYGDLIDANSIERVLDKYRPAEVYNLAAQSVPADSWRQPIVTAEITAVGPVRVLEALRKLGLDARFYQATSREIFGGVQQEVVDETTPFLANNPYGVAKLYAHLMVRTYRQSYGMFACGGILFNHESPRRSLHFVTRKVTMGVACIHLGIKNPPVNEAGEPLVSGGKLRLGNLDSVRDWGYAKEYVEAMWLMLQREEPQDYVIGTNTAYTIRDLCDVAFSRVGLDWQEYVEADARFMRPTEITASRGDYSKARSELGWEPRMQFRELIEFMVDEDVRRLSGGARSSH